MSPHELPGIRFAYRFEGDGHGTKLHGAAIGETVHADTLAWVHLDATHGDARRWLEQEVSYLDPLILDALLAQETRPRILEFENGVLLILRGMNFNEGAEPEDMVSIRLWIDAHRIISLRRRKLKAVQDIRDRLEAGTGPKNAGDFLTLLTSHLFQRMEPVLNELDEATDATEECVMEAPDAALRGRIIDIRKQAIVFRRYISPQRDVLASLRTSPQIWLDAMHRRHLQESHDRLQRYVEDLDAIRERAQIVKDELANALADRLNHNLYVLSVIAAIFLPLGFLTGLLGINVGGLPGVDNPYAFWIFSGMLLVLVMAQVWLFKKLKWF